MSPIPPCTGSRSPRGFTLIELMIVVAIIAIIAAIAIPNLLGSRLSANETKAIATLMQAHSAQSQFRVMGMVDENRDGTSEYGWEGELAGLVPLRSTNNYFLRPSLMKFNPGGNGAYTFRMSLPGAGGAPLLSANGASPGNEEPELCEAYYIVIGWPTHLNSSGRRAFAVKQDGTLYQTDNRGGAQGYDGSLNPMPPLAPLAGPDLTYPISLANNPAPANDAGNWVPVQ